MLRFPRLVQIRPAVVGVLSWADEKVDGPFSLAHVPHGGEDDADNDDDSGEESCEEVIFDYGEPWFVGQKDAVGNTFAKEEQICCQGKE